MARVNWQQVQENDFGVPAELSLADATAELAALLGHPDPQQRDGLARSVLTTWIGRGVYDELLSGLGDGMAAGLAGGLGRVEDDSVFRRSCSAVVLAACVTRDAERPLVPGGKVLEWGDRIATWLLAEQDLRAYVPGHGWAHALAHGADAVGALARSPHFAAAELTVLLDVIGERVCTPADRVLVSGEPDRLAAATVEVLRRDRVPFDIVEAWLGRLADTAVRRAAVPDRDPHLVSGTLGTFLRALYLQLALGPRPPAARADVLLVLVEALRSLDPVAFGPPAAGTALTA